MKKIIIFLMAILEPWVEYCSQDFLEFFCSTTFCRNQGQFPMLNTCILASSGCGGMRAWLQYDVRKRMCVRCQGYNACAIVCLR